MTVGVSLKRVVQTGTGSTAAFNFNAPVLDDDELSVFTYNTSTKAQSLQTKGGSGTYDYTVSINSSTKFATITLNTNLPTSHRITILRNIPLTQGVDYVQGDPFSAETHEGALDKLTLIAAQVQEEQDRSIKVIESSATTDLVMAELVAQKLLVVNDAGNGIDMGPTFAEVDTVGDNIDNVVLVGQNIASVNTVAADLGGSDHTGTVAGAITNVNNVGGNISNVNSVAGNASNINTVAADGTDIGTVAGSIANVNAVANNISNVNTLAAADVIADMAILATADIVADMNTLATADVVADMNTLGTADVVSDMNTLGTADVVSDMNALAVADVINDMSTLADNIGAISAKASSGANSDITSLSGLTTPLSVAQGGTGGANAGAARTALGVAIGSDVQAFDADTLKADTADTLTAPFRGTVTTDNDLSFDLNVTNNFSCTPTGGGTLTFTNHGSAAGQSGFIWLDNSGGHAIAAHANTKINAADLTAISTAGVYTLSYFDNGTNAYVSVSRSFA